MTSWSFVALAQAPAAPEAPPAADEDEDLEVPAAGQAAPTPPVPAPPAAPAAPNAPSDARAEALRLELAALRLRLQRVEANAAKPAPTEPKPARRAAPNADSKEDQPVNLELTAHSRPVPVGLRIGGYVQAQYEANQLSEDQLQPDGTPLNLDRFLLRRGRLRLDRGWEFASATLELDANTMRGADVGIRRGEASVFYRGNNAPNIPPLVMLTLGVTDLQFGFELAESARVRRFMERSLSSLAFFPSEMDVGAKVSGAIAFFRYNVAITNGEPVDNVSRRFPTDPNAAKDITGRFGIDVTPLRGLSVAGGASFNAGKGFHAGAAATKPTFVWRDENEDNVLQPGTELFGSRGLAAEASQNFERWAFGLDLELELETRLGATQLYGEAYIAQNLDRAVFIADPAEDGLDTRHLGGYAAVIQDFTQYAFAGFRASFYDPNSDALDSRKGRLIPRSQVIRTYSPLIGARLPNYASLSFQYDFVDDSLAKDSAGVPTDAENNQWTLRLQVEL